MTVVWHVDDMKISHKSPQDISIMTEELKAKYQYEIGKIKVFRGKVHDYLGMNLDYITIGEVNIAMTDYVKKIIKEYPEYLSTIVATPKSYSLLKTNNNAEKMKDHQIKYIHTTLSRGIFLTNRDRTDTHTAITYLSMRKKYPNTDDEKKLRGMMMLLVKKKELVIRIIEEILNVLKCQIDASYVINHVKNGHTGTSLSMGVVIIHAKATNQKLNDKSITES